VQERLKDTGGRKGKIVNITSIHAEHPRSGAADYDSSKGAEKALGDTLAIELGARARVEELYLADIGVPPSLMAREPFRLPAEPLFAES
jgi:NAD(P)-dependent dehydrogenase (short-subunit alcohol dehydrogenase family)